LERKNRATPNGNRSCLLLRRVVFWLPHYRGLHFLWAR
jgi:hypothetical protein